MRGFSFTGEDTNIFYLLLFKVEGFFNTSINFSFISALICTIVLGWGGVGVRHIIGDFSSPFPDISIGQNRGYFSSLYNWNSTHTWRSATVNKQNKIHLQLHELLNLGEKGKDLTQSFDKTPFPRIKFHKATWQHNNATKNFNYTTIGADLGRSVGLTTATKLVWLNLFMGSQTSHLPQKLCNQKDIRFKKSLNNPPHKDRGPTANQSREAIKSLHKHVRWKKASISKIYKDCFAPPIWERAQVQWLKESRLTIRGNEDQSRVSSEEVWTSPVI